MQRRATAKVGSHVQAGAELIFSGDHDVKGVHSLVPGGVVDVGVLVGQVGIGAGLQEKFDDLSLSVDSRDVKG